MLAIKNVGKCRANLLRKPNIFLLLLENVSVKAYVDKNITNLNIKKWLIKVEKIH